MSSSRGMLRSTRWLNVSCRDAPHRCQPKLRAKWVLPSAGSARDNVSRPPVVRSSIANRDAADSRSPRCVSTSTMRGGIGRRWRAVPDARPTRAAVSASTLRAAACDRALSFPTSKSVSSALIDDSELVRREKVVERHLHLAHAHRSTIEPANQAVQALHVSRLRGAREQRLPPTQATQPRLHRPELLSKLRVLICPAKHVDGERRAVVPCVLREHIEVRLRERRHASLEPIEQERQRFARRIPHGAPLEDTGQESLPRLPLTEAEELLHRRRLPRRRIVIDEERAEQLEPIGIAKRLAGETPPTSATHRRAATVDELFPASAT